MRGSLTGLIALSLLAGCALSAAPPVPVAARLSATALVLEMSDGRLCRLPRAQAAADGPAGWGGPVQGCAGVERVAVTLQEPALLSRLATALFAALTLEELVAPPAEVRVTGPDGRLFVFASPSSADDP